MRRNNSYYLSLVIISSLFFLTGCSENTKEDTKKNTEDTKNVSIVDNEPLNEKTPLSLDDIEKYFSEDDESGMKEKTLNLAGTEAKELILTDSSGTTTSLSDYKGKGVILASTATWCEDCVENIPNLSQYNENNDDVELLGILPFDDEGSFNEFAESYDTDSLKHYMVDESIVENYKLDTVPSYIYVDKDGYIQMITSGILNVEELEEFANQSN